MVKHTQIIFRQFRGVGPKRLKLLGKIRGKWCQIGEEMGAFEREFHQRNQIIKKYEITAWYSPLKEYLKEP